MRSSIFVSPLSEPLAVLSLTIPDLNRAQCPQILITLDHDDGPWRLSIPSGKIDFMVSDSTQGYSVKNATLTDVSSNNGSAVSLALTALYSHITPFPTGAAGV